MTGLLAVDSNERDDAPINASDIPEAFLVRIALRSISRRAVGVGVLMVSETELHSVELFADLDFNRGKHVV